MPFNRYRPSDGTPDYITRDDILKRIHAAWVSFDRTYDARRGAFRDELGKLDDRLKKLQRPGRELPRSVQIATEVGWLLNYRADWDRVSQRLADLEASLATPDQPNDQLADGSWGDCALERYRKLEPTVDMLQKEDIVPQTLKRLAFMAQYQEPKWLLNELWRLQISHIEKTGENHRDQLGATQSALAQLIFKDNLRDVLKAKNLGFEVTTELEQTFLDFFEQTQHPRTGYWGPWYRFGSELFMVQDLSFTFHIVNYRSGNVPRWPEIVDTTLAIKPIHFPMGWMPGGTAPNDIYNNHNNYDVVQILFFGWPYMSQDQKKKAHKEISCMLEWCLTRCLQGDAFAPMDGGDKATLDDFYFGVRFLDRVGFWDRTKRFWTHRIDIQKPTPDEVCTRLKRGFTAVADDSEFAETVAFILQSASCVATAMRDSQA
jgi:hypothetical protein